MKQLFGTDGIRGDAGKYPFDDATVRLIGASLAKQFRAKLDRVPRFVIGRDTRESGERIEAALHAGALSEGAVCESASVITTPGVAYLTQEFDFDAGIVISASHNPFSDNGIKVFTPSGRKLDEATERLVEADIFHAQSTEIADNIPVETEREHEFRDAYVTHLLKIADGLSLDGKTIVLDCANGAASAYAPQVFEKLGAKVITVNCHPDGRNINENCGSTHIDVLQKTVVEVGADIGIAFDGDADRSLFADERGELVDGDSTLWIIARALRSQGDLENSRVVATIMSNIGLELAFDAENIELARTDVGDKYVLDELIRSSSEIGGEQSGHIIFPKLSLVGDGIVTALLLLKATGDKNLSAATEGFTRFPQTLKKAKVKEKLPLESIPSIVEMRANIEREIESTGQGRLNLRYSGTENVARVMIEGEDQAVIDEQALRLVSVIEIALC